MEVNIFIIIMFTVSAVNATLTEGPVSVSALVGENALFHCNGSGITIVWIIDGSLATDSSITDRGITQHTVSSSSGTVLQSNLTVPATLVNNGTTVQCVLYPGEVTSKTATLTVLPGIGPVVNVRFTPSFSDVLWDPPATAGVLSDLKYEMLLMNETGQVLLNETTANSSCPIPVLESCQYYTANVTAFSSQHLSESVVTGQRTPGEYYELSSRSQFTVVSYNITHSAVVFAVDIRQNIHVVVCPNQRLVFVIHPTTNSSNTTTSTEVTITQSGVMKYTVLVRRNCHCAADIKIIADDITEVEKQTVVFSSYNVQDCDVSSDQHTSSILVECTFAINSTAPGIVVIQDDQSQYTIKKTLQRLLQDSDKGSVNITGLPAGEYSVRVYDNSPATDSTSAAYQHSQLIHLMVLPSSSPISSNIIHILSSEYSMSSSSFFKLPMMSDSAVPDVGLDLAANTTTITAALTVVLIVIIVLVTIIVIAIYIKCRAHKKIRISSLDARYRKETENSYVQRSEIKIELPVNDASAVSASNHDSTYMELVTSYLPPPPTDTRRDEVQKELPAKQQSHYAHLQHSTNPAKPAIPVGPVQYATVKQQTDNMSSNSQNLPHEPMYADLYHATNPAAAAPPPELVPVQYADIKKQQVNTIPVQLDQEYNSIDDDNSSEDGEANETTDKSFLIIDIDQAEDSYSNNPVECEDKSNTTPDYVSCQTSPNHIEPTDPNVIQRCLDVSDEGTTPDSGSDTRFTGYFIIEHEDFSAKYIETGPVYSPQPIECTEYNESIVIVIPSGSMIYPVYDTFEESDLIMAPPNDNVLFPTDAELPETSSDVTDELEAGSVCMNTSAIVVGKQWKEASHFKRGFLQCEAIRNIASCAFFLWQPG